MNKILKDYFAIRAEHNKALAALEGRAQRIVNVIKKIFKCKNAWWAFEYYEDEANEPLPREIEDGFFTVYIDADCESGKVCYQSGFPVEFFDMVDQEIEDYIRKEIEECELEEKKKKEEKAKKEADKEVKKQKVLEAIKSKLTKEERKALGLK